MGPQGSHLCQGGEQLQAGSVAGQLPGDQLSQLSRYNMINLTLIFSARWGLKAATWTRVASSCRKAV